MGDIDPSARGELTVGGRRIVLRRGTRTQTVNVCTAENRVGSYEVVFRLPVTEDIQADHLRTSVSLDDLREFLETRNAEVETPGPPGTGPLPIPPPPDADPWLKDAVAAVERALDELVDAFRAKPYLHRVEHSLHAWLYGLLAQQPTLAEECTLRSGEATQLVHKEWPETAPRTEPGSQSPRGRFDLAVLAPAQIQQASLAQYRDGRIAAPIAIEVGLDYPLWHLEQDIDKLGNSAVPHPYLLHLDRAPVRDPRVEERLRKLGPPFRWAYVHWESKAVVRYKRVTDSDFS